MKHVTLKWQGIGERPKHIRPVELYVLFKNKSESLKSTPYEAYQKCINCQNSEK